MYGLSHQSVGLEHRVGSDTSKHWGPFGAKNMRINRSNEIHIKYKNSNVFECGLRILRLILQGFFAWYAGKEIWKGRLHFQVIKQALESIKIIIPTTIQ